MTTDVVEALEINAIIDTPTAQYRKYRFSYGEGRGVIRDLRLAREVLTLDGRLTVIGHRRWRLDGGDMGVWTIEKAAGCGSCGQTVIPR